MKEEDLEAFGKWKIDCTQIVLVFRIFKFSHCFTLKLNVLQHWELSAVEENLTVKILILKVC